MDERSKIEATWHRAYGYAFTWIISIKVGHKHGLGGGGIASGFPQARAVVDDFGTLVLVGEWR